MTIHEAKKNSDMGNLHRLRSLELRDVIFIRKHWLCSNLFDFAELWELQGFQ